MNREARARAFLTNPLKKGHAWADLSYAYDYETGVEMYLGWFDDNAKKSSTDKAKEAVEAYRERYGHLPTVLLVNEADRDVQLGGIDIRVETYIRKNNFWVGYTTVV